QNLDEIRRADITARFEVLDRFQLLLGVSDAAGDRCATEVMRTGFEYVSAWREMIRKRIVHDVARPETGGEQRARRGLEILVVILRLEDRPRRHMQPFCLARRRHVKPG